MENLDNVFVLNFLNWESRENQFVCTNKTYLIADYFTKKLVSDLFDAVKSRSHHNHKNTSD